MAQRSKKKEAKRRSEWMAYQKKFNVKLPFKIWDMGMD